MDFARSIDQIIARHLDELRKPGVLSVRPGYQVAGGWPTKKPAIVVVVDRKRDNLAPQDRLPEMIEGVGVDVREASPLQRMRATNPWLYTGVAAAARPELERPVFPFERDLTGQPLAPLSAAVEAMRRAVKQQLRYMPPAGVSLKPVTDTMTITCHASPDAGWPTLKEFIEGTTKTLTVGMYDFTSTHIDETIQATLGSHKRQLQLVLDHPPGKKTREQTIDQTVQDLTDSLGTRLSFAWALEQLDPKVSSWIYPKAYHIKVAVRDSSSFWLSSGNWNSTNQPDIDPIADPAGARGIITTCDRDWHVIIEHAGLAKTYEAFLLNDLDVARQNQAGPSLMSEAVSVLADLAEPDLILAARTPKQYFAPRVITGRIKIQPILTPDNYIDLVIDLVNSAKKSFYMQTQYINYSDKPEDAKFAALVAAVVKQIDEGLDVRLIMSQYETTDKLELLQGAGLDLSYVRIQANVHNKGIIVDSSVVAVGSQNWSGDGVLRNRDATVIIYNEEAAQYWEEIFLHDWTKMAAQHALD